MLIKILSGDSSYLFRKEQQKNRRANKDTQLKFTFTSPPWLLDLLSQTTLGRCKDHKFSFCPAQAAR